jgi:iron complex transport system substrate-binding protein
MSNEISEKTNAAGHGVERRVARGWTRRSFLKLGLGTVAVAGMAGLSACGTQNASQGSGASGANGSTQEITDLAGNTVSVPTNITKIVDFWHAHNQIVFMLGAADKLVGTTDNFKKMKWANVVYPGLANVESLVTGSGSNQAVNYEEALNLSPDVCFASSKDMVTSGTDQGLTMVNVMFQDYEGLRDDVNLTAKILGSDAQKTAQKWEDLLDENIKTVEDRMSGVSDSDKVKVLHIVSPSSLTKVDGTNCIVDEWIKLAGGVNAIQTEGNMIDVTMEDIVKADPEVIIIGSGAADAVQKLLSDSAWSGVTAVENKAVYANPTGVFPWDRYSGEEALQVLWAAQKLNPDKFSDIDMVAKTREFYKDFYGFDLTDDQANRIINAQDPA